MNLVCYIVLLKTTLLAVLIEAQVSSIEALLRQSKWKIANFSPFCHENVKVDTALQMNPNLRKEFCSYFSELNGDRRFPPTSKKSASSHCECKSEKAERDLGNDFYPRSIPERRCVSTSCCVPPLACKEITHSVQVLRPRQIDEEEDKELPKSLRHCWRFTTINVTVACECGMKIR